MESFKECFTRFKLLFILASILLFNILPAVSAYAVSDYDDVIHTGSSYVINNNWSASGGRCGLEQPLSTDMVNTWASYLSDPSKYVNTTLGNAGSEFFKEVLTNNGGWSVAQMTSLQDYGTFGGADMKAGDTALQIVASKSRGTNFYDVGGGNKTLRTNSTDTRVYNITYFNTEPHCSVKVSYYDGPGSAYIAQSVITVPGYQKINLLNFDIPYPENYEGVVPSVDETDGDDDGLNATQESYLGTSDSLTDSDRDGLDDLTESPWYTNRDALFCDTSTPKNCSYPNPAKKDVYVEVDWMDDGTESYIPTTTQLDLVKNAFDAKNIAVHFDTGQYGGGNELPVYISPLKVAPDSNDTDYFNLKNGDDTYIANFSENRRGIWRYMVAADKHFANGTADSTGAAYPGDDDIVVSIGRVKELNSMNVDTAVAGTIMHELGHSLCLTDTPYTWMDSACFYTGVDSFAGNNYVSSMNYDKQFSLVDYSLGLNNTGDHDDWSGVLVGMDDFVTLGADPTENLNRGGPGFDKPLLSGRD